MKTSFGSDIKLKKTKTFKLLNSAYMDQYIGTERNNSLNIKNYWKHLLVMTYFPHLLNFSVKLLMLLVLFEYKLL